MTIDEESPTPVAVQHSNSVQSSIYRSCLGKLSRSRTCLISIPCLPSTTLRTLKEQSQDLSCILSPACIHALTVPTPANPSISTSSRQPRICHRRVPHVALASWRLWGMSCRRDCFDQRSCWWRNRLRICPSKKWRIVHEQWAGEWNRPNWFVAGIKLYDYISELFYTF